MESEVVRLMRSYRSALLQRETGPMQFLVQQWSAIARSLRDSIEALAAELGAGSLTRAKLVRMERYQRLLVQVNRELERYSTTAASVVTTEQQTLIGFGLSHAVEALQVVAGVGVSFARLPVDAVEIAAGFAADGTPLATLLRQSYPAVAEQMTTMLVRGVGLGWNPRRTASAMVRELDVVPNNALRLARTEGLRAYRESSRQAYQASGIVRSYLRLCAKGPRTCAACLLADGREYQLDEPLDEHVQGRCTLIPKVAGIDPPTWQTGKDWLQEQDEATQQTVLGKAAHAAWQDGKIGLDDLVTVKRDRVWGNSLQVTPLRSLI